MDEYLAAVADEAVDILLGCVVGDIQLVSLLFSLFGLGFRRKRRRAFLGDRDVEGEHTQSVLLCTLSLLHFCELHLDAAEHLLRLSGDTPFLLETIDRKVADSVAEGGTEDH